MSRLITQEIVTRMMLQSERIEASIRVLREFGHSEEEIKKYLVRQFSISEKYAQNFLDLDPDRDRDGIWAI